MELVSLIKAGFECAWVMNRLPRFDPLKDHGASCVVLIINDNFYVLMITLIYIRRTCP
jgi:hypothetical protein